MSLKIVHHHVGARGNVRIPLDTNSPLREDFEFYYYDADPEAIDADLERLLKASSVTLLPYCIADGPGRRPFHVMRNRFQSSLFPFNDRYAPFVQHSAYGESNLGFGGVVDELVEIDATSLDALCLEQGEAPPPDYLSIDTEGGEGLILAGAARVLARSVLWVKAETWIHPLQVGGGRLHEILVTLENAGFDFVDIEKYAESMPASMPIGLQGGGFVLGGESVFARKLESFDNGALAERPDDERILALYKLAMLAAMHKQVALAVLCLDRAEAMGGSFLAGDGGQPPTHYLRFLARLHEMAKHQRRHWASFVDFDDIRRGAMMLGWRLRRGAVENPDAARAEERANRSQFLNGLEPRLKDIQQLYWLDRLPMEDLFHRYGMSDQGVKLAAERKERAAAFIKQFYALRYINL